jgi:hypothetical protein
MAPGPWPFLGCGCAASTMTALPPLFVKSASTRIECPAQARRVPSASTDKLLGAPRSEAATVDAAASRAGERARWASGLAHLAVCKF